MQVVVRIQNGLRFGEEGAGAQALAQRRGAAAPEKHAETDLLVQSTRRKPSKP